MNELDLKVLLEIKQIKDELNYALWRLDKVEEIVKKELLIGQENAW